jgi:hypothetical protein
MHKTIVFWLFVLVLLVPLLLMYRTQVLILIICQERVDLV